MSKTIQIRKVPDAVHHQLKVRAADAGVSLSDYLLDFIQAIATQPPIADVLRRAGNRSWGADPDTIVDVIHELRDREP